MNKWDANILCIPFQNYHHKLKTIIKPTINQAFSHLKKYSMLTILTFDHFLLY